MLDIIDEVLACPSCGGEYLHIDNVHISARKEDADFTEIRVDAITGDVETNAGPGPGDEGRRHRVSLIGWCEFCGDESAIVFRQHKGETQMDIVKIRHLD